MPLRGSTAGSGQTGSWRRCVNLTTHAKSLPVETRGDRSIRSDFDEFATWARGRRSAASSSSPQPGDPLATMTATGQPHSAATTGKLCESIRGNGPQLPRTNDRFGGRTRLPHTKLTGSLTKRAPKCILRGSPCRPLGHGMVASRSSASPNSSLKTQFLGRKTPAFSADTRSSTGC